MATVITACTSNDICAARFTKVDKTARYRRVLQWSILLVLFDVIGVCTEKGVTKGGSPTIIEIQGIRIRDTEYEKSRFSERVVPRPFTSPERGRSRVFKNE